MGVPQPATRKEEALWLLEKLFPGTGVNNLSFTFRVAGTLSPAALQDAVSAVVRRHEVLRTVFHDDDAELRRLVRPADELRVEVERVPTTDLSDVAGFVSRPFRFDGGPLLRVGHFTGPEDEVVCLAVHHLVFDTISAGPLLAELVAAYAGRVPEGQIPALREPEPGPRSAAYWHDQLRGFDPGELDLWCGRQESTGGTLAGGQVVVPLSPEAQTAVRDLRSRLNTSEAVVLLTAYFLLLAAHGAGPDVAVGTMVNTRGPADQRAIGYHVNVVPVRMAVDTRKGFADLARQTGGVFLDAIAHADMPVDSLYDEVGRGGTAWRNTLFRHVFNYVPGLALPDFEIGGATASPVIVELPVSKFDLEFFVMSTQDEIRVRAVHSTDALDRDDVVALLARYDALLVALAADTEQPVHGIPVWSEHDRAVVAAANDTGSGEVGGTVLDAIRARVAATPDAVALEDGDRRTTYAELWATSATVRDLLADAGTKRGDVVALVAPRGVELAAAVLGVWRAGATYLPLDPTHPPHRIAYQLTDSGATTVLAALGVRVTARPGVRVVRLPAEGDGHATRPDVDPVDAAYLIYTSGSTGRPKGTVVGHDNLANLIEHFRDELAVTAGQGMAWLTTFSFDISALELLLPLVSGGRVVVATDSVRTDGRELAGLLTRHRVDVVQATPTTWRLVLPDCGETLAGRKVLCGGESLPATLAHRLLLTGCEPRNVYGPTETTIWSTCGPVADEPQISIGRPIRGTRVFVARDGRELPVGVRGELCIAGAGVANGYHNRPELTEDRFRDHPGLGRHYRTGDLARWRHDGTLDVLGRVDRQVKLRGNRIEPGEVEGVLLDHPSVDAAAVLVTGEDERATLVAFVVADYKPGIAGQLWEHARAGLPAPSVPGEFFVVPTLPRTGNDKVDYLALARDAEDRLAAATTDQEQVTTTDPDDPTGTLVGIWQEVLNRGGLGADSNFFVSGGHSLLGAQLVQRVEERIGVRLRLAELFTHPTPRELAEFLRPAR